MLQIYSLKRKNYDFTRETSHMKLKELENNIEKVLKVDIFYYNLNIFMKLFLYRDFVHVTERTKKKCKVKKKENTREYNRKYKN